MPQTRRTTLKRLAVASAATALAGCTNTSSGDERPENDGDPESNETSPSSDTETDERGDYTVEMHTELYNDPVGLYVEPGDTVSFELVSGAHSATAYHPDNENAMNRRIPEDAPAWDTGVFGEVGTFRNVTFETEGTHDYYCIPHKMVGMVGRIVVGEPGGPAEESDNPDLPLPDSSRIVDEESVAWEDWQSNV